MSLTRRLLAVGSAAVIALLGPQLSVACAQNADRSGSSEVAQVGDTIITLEDVDDAWNQSDAATRIRVLQQVYDARRGALDLVIGDRLIDREAEARGVSREELLATELPARTLPATDQEVQMAYDRNRQALGGRTLEEVRSEIVAAIEGQRPAQALRQYMAELRRQADDVVLTPQALDPPRQQVEFLPDDPSRGPADAAVVLVEFSDFQCPFCQVAAGTLEELFDRYEGQVRFIYKDYPLPSHPQAFKAAEAGNCAHEQGKFWEFHDKMFASQEALEVPMLNSYALELGLDAPRFAICLEEGRYTQRVREDLRTGQEYGVSSTPSMFINGRPVLGSVPLEVFDEIIRDELAASQR